MFGHFPHEAKSEYDIEIIILDIDNTACSYSRAHNGKWLKRILNEKCLSPYIVRLVTGKQGVYFCTHRTDINFYHNVIQHQEQTMSHIKYRGEIKERYDRVQSSDDEEKWYKTMTQISKNPSDHPNLMCTDLNPEDFFTHKIIENLTQKTGVPCLGVVTPGFAADILCKMQTFSESRFYDFYTHRSDEEYQSNYDLVKNMKMYLNYEDIDYDRDSKNRQLQIILDKIAAKYPGKKVKITYADDVKKLCLNAAAELQAYCNELASQNQGLMKFEVIHHIAFEEVDTPTYQGTNIPVMRDAEDYSPKPVVLSPKPFREAAPSNAGEPVAEEPVAEEQVCSLCNVM